MRLTTLPLLASVLLATQAPGPTQAPKMSFFITSAGPGDGANLGGLEGADRKCKELAEAAGARAQRGTPI